MSGHVPAIHLFVFPIQIMWRRPGEYFLSRLDIFMLARGVFNEHNKRLNFLGIVTWSALEKQNRQAIKVYGPLSNCVWTWEQSPGWHFFSFCKVKVKLVPTPPQPHLCSVFFVLAHFEPKKGNNTNAYSYVKKGGLRSNFVMFSVESAANYIHFYNPWT